MPVAPQNVTNSVPQPRYGARPFDRRLYLIVFAVVCAVCVQTVPSKSSFVQHIQATYPRDVEPYFSFMKVDKSMSQKPPQIKYASFHFFGIGHTKRHKYRHYYLGIFKLWIPLPYAPKPGTGKHVSPGVCIMGHCICVPNPDDWDKCLKVEWDRGYLLAYVMIMHVGTYILQSRESMYEWTMKNLKLCFFNLAQGRLWTLFLSTFLVTSFVDLVRSCMLVATVLDVMFDSTVSDGFLMILWLVGSWMYFLTDVLFQKYRRKKNANDLMYVMFHGNNAAITTLLSFHWCINPRQRYSYSFVPIDLGAPHLAAVMAILDVPYNGISALACHASAFLMGQYAYSVWLEISL